MANSIDVILFYYIGYLGNISTPMNRAILFHILVRHGAPLAPVLPRLRHLGRINNGRWQRTGSTASYGEITIDSYY